MLEACKTPNCDRSVRSSGPIMVRLRKFWSMVCFLAGNIMEKIVCQFYIDLYRNQ